MLGNLKQGGTAGNLQNKARVVYQGLNLNDQLQSGIRLITDGGD